jgi:hypothetical protein
MHTRRLKMLPLSSLWMGNALYKVINGLYVSSISCDVIYAHISEFHGFRRKQRPTAPPAVPSQRQQRHSGSLCLNILDRSLHFIKDPLYDAVYRENAPRGSGMPPIADSGG